MGDETADLRIQGFNLDDPAKARQIADELRESRISVAKTGFYLAQATVAVLLSSWLVINWATYMVFCVALGVWHAAMLVHLYALYKNCENRHTTVEDTVYMISSVSLSWAAFLAGSIFRKCQLVERTREVLVRIFGPVQEEAMKAARWMMIVSALMWVLGMVWEIGQILAMQPVDAPFHAPSWVT